MEFYLVDELECDLVVFHPYRTLMTLCGKDDGTAATVIEAGELGAGGMEFVPAGPGEVWEGNGIKRYWGSGQGKLLLDDKTLQLAWLVSSPFSLQRHLIIVFGFAQANHQ